MIPAPSIITAKHLSKNPRNVFVYESNYAGTLISDDEILAKRFGASYAVPAGLSQNTYALSTRCHRLRPLRMEQIEAEIARFWRVVALYPDCNFLVAEIGAKAGYAPTEIAPFFDFVVAFDNVYLPPAFVNILNR